MTPTFDISITANRGKRLRTQAPFNPRPVLPRPPANGTHSEALPSKTHRYVVGQRLIVSQEGRAFSQVAGACEVLWLLPWDSGPFLYRIRSDGEQFVRVVSESDLRPADPI